MQTYKVYINNECKIITENWDCFSSRYSLIDAAGGVVYNHKRQILMIFRNSHWDLPKGKLEPYESIEDCAIREVKEECGINNLHIEKKIVNTYHVYSLNNQDFLKRTFWFEMSTKYNGILVPQVSEGITKVEWVGDKDIEKRLENSYGNIKDLLINRR